VVVLAEIEEGEKLAASFLEALHAARKIAEAYETRVDALVLGNNVEKVVEEITYYGLDTIYVVDDAHLGTYHPECYLSAFRRACKDIRPTAIVMGHTLRSIDLAPRIAFDLDAGLISDCTGIDFDSDEMVFFKPVFSGNVVAGYTIETRPFIVSMRPKSLEPVRRLEKEQGSIIRIPADLAASDIRIAVTDWVVREHAGIKLEDAAIIVAGGRGMGSAERFRELAVLAEMLGAAVGASRPPVDMGWVPSESQVGQTGVIVAPDVYFAIGISGSIQHIAGMANSRTIVAINTDPEANIFKIADYGIVGSCAELIPSLIEAFQETVNSPSRN